MKKAERDQQEAMKLKLAFLLTKALNELAINCAAEDIAKEVSRVSKGGVSQTSVEIVVRDAMVAIAKKAPVTVRNNHIQDIALHVFMPALVL